MSSYRQNTKPYKTMAAYSRDLSTVHSCLYTSFRYSFLNSVTYQRDNVTYRLQNLVVEK